MSIDPSISAWEHFKTHWDLHAAVEAYVESETREISSTTNVAQRFFQELSRALPIPQHSDVRMILPLLDQGRAIKDQDVSDTICKLAFRWLFPNPSSSIQKLFDSSPDRVRLLMYIAKIPQEKLKDVLESALPFLEGFEGTRTAYEMLELVNENPPLAAAITQVISEVPLEKRKALLELFFHQNQGAMQNVIELANTASPEEKLEFLEALLTLIRHGGTGASWEVLKTLREISESERYEMLSVVKDIARDIKSNRHRAKIIQVVHKALPEERKVILDAILTLAKDFSDEEHHHGVAELLDRIVGIPKESRGELLGLLAGLLTGIQNDNREQIDNFSERLLRWFSSANDRKLVHRAAKLILSQPAIDELGVDHPFYQGILIFAIESRADDEDPTNPYTVHARVLEGGSQLSSLDPTIQHMNGQNLSINLHTLKSRYMAPMKVVRFKDLPQVSVDSMKTLFDTLRERLQKLPSEQRAEATKHIEGLSGEGSQAGIGPLARSFNSPALRGLLQRDSNPEVVVSPASVRFFMIMHHILSLQTTLEEGVLFSLQEEAFLQIAASIQSCPTGQLDGVNRVFLELPTSPIIGLDPGEDILRMVILGTLEQLLNYGDSPLLHELTGVPEEEEIEQFVHQSMYVKNLLAPRFNLPHHVTFDLGTHTLYRPLIQKTLEEVMESFERHFVQRLARNIAQDYVHHLVVREKTNQESEKTLVSKKKDPYVKVYNDLVMGLLRNADQAQCWDLTDPEKPSLTEVGAVELLIGMGLLIHREILD